MLATLCITTTIGGSVLVTAPAQATPAPPSVNTVQARADRLHHQADVASTRYYRAWMQLHNARTQVSTLHTDLVRKQAAVERLRQQLAASVVAQYLGQDPAPAAQLPVSYDSGALSDRLTTMSADSDRQTWLMGTYAQQVEQLTVRERQARSRLPAIASTKRQLGAAKTRVDDRAGQAQHLLDQLKERAARAASRSASRTAASSTGGAPVSGRAAAAVSYAKAQVGKAYVYGAAGPSAFDCSGLTMMAWAQAGVALPHNSSAQMGSGRSISQSELQPGDLVFYYSPVSHVGMYIGNGQVVNAENPGVGIIIASVNSMPYAGAVRPG